jgi:hypothetical protein
MDGERFDSLIKRFTVTRVTRLEAVRGLLAGAGLAVTGAAFASEIADAKSKHKGKKKKKSKKGKGGSSNNQQGSYTSPSPSPTPPPYSGGDNNKHDDPIKGTTTGKPTCDKYEDCGYDAYWDDSDCRCICNKYDKGYEYCDNKDSYDYGTCKSTECDGYQEYDSYSCSCQDIKCDKNEAYCSYGDYAGQCVSTKCDYGTYNSDTCSCDPIECKKYEVYCSYGKYAGQCVSTDCSSYGYGYEYSSDSCSCEAV